MRCYGTVSRRVLTLAPTFIDVQQGAPPAFIALLLAPATFMDTRQGTDLMNAVCNLPPQPVPLMSSDTSQNVANPENNSPLHASMSEDSQKHDVHATNEGPQILPHAPTCGNDLIRQNDANAVNNAMDSQRHDVHATDEDPQFLPHAPVCGNELTQQDDANATNNGMDSKNVDFHATDENPQIFPHAPACGNELTRQDDANAANNGMDPQKYDVHATNEDPQILPHAPACSNDLTWQDDANVADNGIDSQKHDVHTTNEGPPILPHAPARGNDLTRQDEANAANNGMDSQKHDDYATNEDPQILPHAPTCGNDLTQQDDANVANNGICVLLHAQAVTDIQLDVPKAEEEENLYETSKHNNADNSKFDGAPLKRKRSSIKASTQALIHAAKKDMEHAAPSKEAVNIQVQLHAPEEIVASLEKAAAKAHTKILSKGKAVLVREVVQESLRRLGYISLESVGICMYDVPCLHNLIKLEAKLNMLIACHVAVREITTLHDLSEEILSAENVKSFEELGVGPLSLQPLVFRYFAPPKDAAICKLTAMDVLEHLKKYLNKHARTFSEKGFLSYMVKSRCLPSASHLCVRIKNFRLYASCILREKKVSKKSTIYKQVITTHEEIATVEKESSVKNDQEVNTARYAESCRAKVMKGSTHAIYISSSEEDAKESIPKKLVESRCNEEPHLTGCPYPSATEEQRRLLSKIPLQGNEKLQEYSVPAQELKGFISTWRNICLNYPIDEVLTQLYDSVARKHTLPNGQKNITMRKKKLLKLFKLHPAVEILNVVVLLMKSSHCSSFLDTYEGSPNNIVKTTKDDVRRTVLKNTADQRALSEHDQLCYIAEALGFKFDVSVSDLLNLLKVWNQRPFKTTVSQMTQLYEFMWNGATVHKEDIVAFLKNEPCIFVPAKIKAKTDKLSKGRLYPSSCLFWEDCTGSIAKLVQTKDAFPDVSAFRICLKALNTLYPTLHSFLVGICHVQATPSFHDYFAVLKTLANHFSPQDVLPEVLAIFEIWSHDISMGHVKTSDVRKWKELLQRKESRILPTLQDKWVSLDGSEGLVCWCDNVVLREQSSDIKNIFYVCMDSTSLDKTDAGNASRQTEKLIPFFQAMGILPLSQVVKREPVVHGARWSKQMFDMLHWSLAYTQRYLQKWHGDMYNNVIKVGFATRLKKIQCICADELFFCYTLPGGFGAGQKQFKIEHLFQGDTFYATNLENLNSLYLEFSRIFFDGFPNFQLANFLHLVRLSSLSGSTGSELEALLASQGIGPLSKDKKHWSFDCHSVDGEQKAIDFGNLPQHFRVRDDMFKQRITNSTSLVWPWHQTRKKMVYECLFPENNRVAALQKSLDTVMDQIEAKKKEMLVDGERQHTYPSLKSRGCLVGPGKMGFKRKDAPAMFEKAMGPLEKKCRPSKDAMDAQIESACGTAIAAREFALSGVDIQRHFADSNPINGLPKADAANGNKLQKELAAGNGALIPKDTHTLNALNQKQTCFGHQSEQEEVLTSRLGEALVYNHLVEKYKTGCVRWMNAEVECGLPYDIVVDGVFSQQLLVAVKATSLEHDCFVISNHEWEFAAQAGERFVIIRAFLGGTKGVAQLLWLPHPVNLCQKGTINLALRVPQHHPKGPEPDAGPDACH